MTEKENHLPNLSSEERAHALELAMQARRRYAALKARVKSGELTFTDAMDEEDAKRILVTSLLQSVPGIGASKAVGERNYHHQADRCAEFRSHEEPARLYQR